MTFVYRRTMADVEKALKALSSYFKEDFFVLVGSQASLISWNSTPDEMRNTPEIDVYLAAVRRWEEENPGREADFEIAGNFGQGSYFHQAFGFYIDGVSPETAALPEGWKMRAAYHEIAFEGRQITAVAPCIEDLVVSKMCRLAEKDQEYIVACSRTRGLDLQAVSAGLETAPFQNWERQRAKEWLKDLPGRSVQLQKHVEAPAYPPDGSHCAFWSKGGYQVTIREFDERSGLYYRISNPLGPAVVTPSAKAFYLHGKRTVEERLGEAVTAVPGREMR